MADGPQESHEISLAVWGLTSPLTAGQPARVMVGAKCAAGCSLAGQTIAIQSDSRVEGKAMLGLTPWPGTTALHWAEVRFDVSLGEGRHVWEIALESSESTSLHLETRGSLSLTVVPRPEHRLAITVVDRSTEFPIHDVDVRLGPHKGLTDLSGIAHVDLARGKYELAVWKHGYKILERSLEVVDDSAIHLKLDPDPEPEPEYWMG